MSISSLEAARDAEIIRMDRAYHYEQSMTPGATRMLELFGLGSAVHGRRIDEINAELDRLGSEGPEAS